MLPQRKFREVVFQLLYAFDFTKNEEKEELSLLFDQVELPQDAIYLAQEKVQRIAMHFPVIDALIAKASQGYRIERIAKAELNILRLGAFELLYDGTIPSKVAISEAIRLTRKFSTKEGATFVNAVLDRIYQQEGARQEETCLREKAGSCGA